MYLALGAAPAPFDPAATRQALDEHAVGEELTTLFDYFQSTALAGYVIRGEVEIAPTVISIEGDTATVRDCYADTTGVYRLSDGSRVDAEEPGRRQVQVDLQRVNGIWKVSAIHNQGTGCTP